MNKYVVCLAGWVAVSAIGCGSGGNVGDPEPPQSIKECTLIGCLNGARYQGSFPIGGSDLNTLELKTCLNGSCDRTPIRFAGTGRLQFDCSSDIRRVCSLWKEAADAQVNIWLTMQPLSGGDALMSLQDGDHYEVTIGTPGQAPLLALDTIAQYEISRPNGPQCDPVCKSVQLMPAP